MAVSEPTILVFPLVTKHHTNACARPDRYSAKVRSDRYVKALLLSPYNSLQIKICMAFAVKIHIYRVQHRWAPVAVCR
ncbi:hypothetical protein SAMN05444503_102125 [Pseudomonas sp. BS3767]|uniref:Uncharacterized protein n=1 Tax=Pseudomonas syringae TaxID=317 RepID=A0AB37ZDY8_PSESX|nr:hypothetical protein SAMN05444503_102125 [Pseudomonas sp. BS3767]SDL93778.1 hypothetical protein SAMN05444505_101126 [Pseudomonas syringae]SDM24675.1 hypothetical protein SAMN05444502_101125 [Pseudomonas sp. BS3759]